MIHIKRWTPKPLARLLALHGGSDWERRAYPAVVFDQERAEVRIGRHKIDAAAVMAPVQMETVTGRFKGHPDCIEITFKVRAKSVATIPDTKNGRRHRRR